jgi:hypothetical protein
LRSASSFDFLLWRGQNYVFIHILVSFVVILWWSQSAAAAGFCRPALKEMLAMNRSMKSSVNRSMYRSMSSFAAAALIAATVALPNQARADGSDLAAGIFGGLIAGAIVGSAVAPRGPGPEPVYVVPEPYYQEPVCFGRQQMYDPYYRVYRWQRVRVPCY